MPAADGFHKNRVTRDERAHRNGHPGRVVWLTGFSGSGKSTLARALERRLFSERCHVYVLDGDLVRTGLCSDLTYSIKDRTENIRRVGEVARLMADAGTIVIAAFISPMRADRDRIRAACHPGEFIEVFVNAPLEVCEKRDVKGLYAKARTNVLKEFTGISSPYEAPLKPEVELRTDMLGIEECVDRIVLAIGTNN